MNGRELSHFRILEPIGEGGMGVVYRAVDLRLDRPVALKLLPPGLGADPARRQRFEREARAASALNHPNIVTIYEIGRDAEQDFIAMELVEGRSLRQSLAGGGLPTRLAVDYAVQIARGLAAAHARGIVHRDLKPENLMLTSAGTVKILDFGLARLERDEGALESTPTHTQLTQPGALLGTAGYMSPEQVRGQAADQRADIFAFGAILYELLTGQRAFRGGSRVETLNAILKDAPELGPRSRELLPGLDGLLRHCLEKDPERRYQSAHDLAVALEGLARAEGASAAAPRRARPAASWIAGAAAAAVLLALAWAGGASWLRQRLVGAPAAGSIRSIAVLPLQNLARDAGQEYFADGMTDALIETLSKIGALRVISRTSAMRYKGAARPLREIARELGVDAVVEGSVLHSGERLRISVQLVDGASETSLWAESYQRDLEDVLALQSDVARAIAAEIRVRLSPAEHQRLASPARVDPAAHEAYLKGRFQWNKRTADSLFEAIRFLEQALAIEPRYAAAHAALGSCYVLLPASLIGAQAPAEAMPRAKSAALEAIRLDEGNAEAHAVLGYVQTGYEWDWEGAQRSFRRAIDLNPSYATGRFWYAAHLAARGRTAEAVEEAREAQRLDPISPIITAGVAWMHHLARRYDLAEQQARRTLELAPDFPIGLGRLGSALEAAGRPEQAVEPFERAVAASGGSPEMLAALARAQALCGRRPEALAGLAALDALAQRRYVSDYSLATVHAALGDAGRALDRLEESYRRREWPLAFLAVEPAVDSLRSQARFQDLARRLGLEPPPPGARE